MTFSVVAANHLNARGAVMPRWLLWVQAKQYTTLAPYPVGLWNGWDDLTFTIDGQSRVYQGALSQFEIEPIVYGTGLDVRTLQITLAANAPETQELVRGYITRLAPVELHLAMFDPETHALIDVERRWKGWINSAPINTAALGAGGETVTFRIVSAMRKLALQGPALNKTDEAMKKRSGDRLFRYGSTSGQVRVEWFYEDD